MSNNNVSNYVEQGGARHVIGGSLDVVSGGDLDIESGAALKIAGTDVTAELLAINGVTATAAELNAVADKSTSVVTTTANLTLTAALHAERLVVVNKADGAAIVLPAATGTGNKFTVIIGTTISSNSTTIKAASDADSFVGMAIGSDTDGEGATGYTWNADSADDTVTMTGTTNGGVAGDVFTFIDYATGLFLVEGRITQSGGSEVTPFSATVS